MGPLHPESPARLHAIDDQLIASGLHNLLRFYDAPLASREQLSRAHSTKYIDDLFARAPEKGTLFIDPDTSMGPHTLRAALRAAGSGILAVDLLRRGEVNAAFCSVRPPGHHATRDRAMGFCFFNNIAVAAAHALKICALKRIAIVDFDVHHGNGTEDIFHDDERVLFCSTFQHPLYPNSGADTGSDHIVNVPLNAGCGGAEFRKAVRTKWLPALHAHRPELVLISAGFDAHRDDDMAGLGLIEADYSWVTAQVHAIARQYCNSHIVSMLEGGYALHALGRSVAAHIKALF